MLTYFIVLEDDDGTLLAMSPDFPELTTFGMDRDEVLARAVDAIEEAIAAGRDIPSPSHGREVAVLPTLTAVKGMLYQEQQGIGKAEAPPSGRSGIGRAAQLAHGSARRSNGCHRHAPVH